MLSKKKKVFAKPFARFLAFSNKILTIQKKVLSSVEEKAIFEDLRLRGQGQGRSRGLHLWLQNIKKVFTQADKAIKINKHDRHLFAFQLLTKFAA